MAAPETCGAGKSGTVESGDAARHADRPPGADGGDLAAADKDNAVRMGFSEGLT